MFLFLTLPQGNHYSQFNVYPFMPPSVNTHANTMCNKFLFLIFTKIRSLYIIHLLFFKLKTWASFHEQS